MKKTAILDTELKLLICGDAIKDAFKHCIDNGETVIMEKNDEGEHTEITLKFKKD